MPFSGIFTRFFVILVWILYRTLTSNSSRILASTFSFFLPTSVYISFTLLKGLAHKPILAVAHHQNLVAGYKEFMDRGNEATPNLLLATEDAQKPNRQ